MILPLEETHPVKLMHSLTVTNLFPPSHLVQAPDMATLWHKTVQAQARFQQEYELWYCVGIGFSPGLASIQVFSYRTKQYCNKYIHISPKQNQYDA